MRCPIYHSFLTFYLTFYLLFWMLYLIFISVKISHWLHWVLDLLLYQVLWSSDPSTLSELGVPSNERCSMFHLIYLMSDKILNTISIFYPLNLMLYIHSVGCSICHSIWSFIYSIPSEVLLNVQITINRLLNLISYLLLTLLDPLSAALSSIYSTGNFIWCSTICSTVNLLYQFFFFLSNESWIYIPWDALSDLLSTVRDDWSNISYALLDIKPFEVRSKYII